MWPACCRAALRKIRLRRPQDLRKQLLEVASRGAPPVTKRAGARSTRERLQATLRQGDEALSPRVLRRILQELQAVIDERVSAGRRWSSRRSLDGLVRRCHIRPAAGPLVADERNVCRRPGQGPGRSSQVCRPPWARRTRPPPRCRYRRATVSPRRRLLQRFSADATGIRFLVNLRQSAVRRQTDKRLRALDVEMEYMFSTWFDVGFLELRRISWDSPASLVEKLIKYEAVHVHQELGRA